MPRPAVAPRTVAATAALAAVGVSLAVAAPASAASTQDPTVAVVINEVIQNNPAIPDSIELTNTGAVAVDVSGWVLADDRDREPELTLPEGTVIAPGAFLAVVVDVDVDDEAGFGLGRADEARLLLPDGTLLDRFAWSEHTVTSYGRNPDGTGDFAITAAATPGAPNLFAAPGQDVVVINEVESNQGTPGDWVELLNTGDETVDLTGWVLRDDNDANGYALPQGSTIAAGDYLVLEEADFGFGLGGNDAARLYLPDATTLVDATSWSGHAATTWGRCPDGIGAFTVTLEATKGGPNACADVVVPDVVINEIDSNQGVPGDWVELFNTGDSAADLSGWIITDSDPLHVSVIADGTVLEPGAFLVVEETQLGYGLGAQDAVRLFLADGITLIDEHAWDGHAATTLGRCPDGTGEFQVTAVATKGAANDCAAALRLNEVESSGDADWVELVNAGTSPVDASGMLLRDGGADNDPIVLPTPTIIEPGGYLQVFTEPTFGLGGNDLVRLIDTDGTVLDETSWTSHAAVTWGRCPDTSGPFGQTREATPGAPNSCEGDLVTVAWPGSPEVTTADVAGTFGGDMSGAVFIPVEDPEGPAQAWAVNNGSGSLHRIVLDADQVSEADGWTGGATLRYPDGTGTVDAEAVALSAEAGIVYVGSERNTAGASSISRPSVLRYAVDETGPTGELVAQVEWNLTAEYPGIGANAGIEGLTWIPDSVLVAAGLTDLSTGEAYQPERYGAHGDGVFLVGVEATGVVGGYVLELDGSITRVTELDTAFPGIMELEYEPATGEVWAYCDEVCEGRSQVFALTGGSFEAQVVVDRPAGMANLANEGLAFAPQAFCVDGAKPVLWVDDAETDGHAFRVGSIDCQAGDDGDGTGNGDGDGDGAGDGDGDGAGDGDGDGTGDAGATPTASPSATGGSAGGSLPDTGANGALGFVALAAGLVTVGGLILGSRRSRA